MKKILFNILLILDTTKQKLISLGYFFYSCFVLATVLLPLPVLATFLCLEK